MNCFLVRATLPLLSFFVWIAPHTGSAELRILTYNIHHGEGTDSKFDLERIAELIKTQRPDLVAVQEIDVKTTRASGVDQAAELGRLTGMYYSFGKFMDYASGESGQMVLSKHPILSMENFKLPNGYEPRTAMIVCVKLPAFDAPAFFVGNHLYGTADQRKAQAKALVDKFSETKAPVIMAGDFNSKPDSPPMRLLREAGWVDPALGSENAATFPSNMPRRRIDYVLFRPKSSLTFASSRVIDERVASDHRPVLTVLESPAVAAFAGHPPRPPARWTDGYVLANGIRIHYWRTGGDKPVMIMAHGSSDNGLCWTQLAKELTDDYDIILPDARGHGLSDPPSKSDPADAQAEDIAGLIRELKLDKPIIMGHSMGSSSAAWFAAKYPEIPRAVILEDPRLVPRPASASRDSDNSEAKEKRRAQILARNNLSYAQIVSDQLKRNPKWGRTEIEIWATSKLQHHPNTAYRRRGNRPPMIELFAKITAPTLILKADDQGELRQKNIEAAKVLAHGKIVHVEDARHNVRRDQKERLLKALKEFLDQNVVEQHAGDRLPPP